MFLLIHSKVESMEISVIGTGMIAREVLAMLRKEDLGIGVSSIYAHQDKAKADELAGEYGIERVFTDYEALLREDKADFLYIAVVNTAHYPMAREALLDRKSTRLNSSHANISYAVFCLKKKK